MWFAIVIRRLGLGLWLSGIPLLALGLARLLLHPVPPAAVVLAGLLPPLAAVVAALAWQRPEWVAAARAADRQADADSLLLSAWDLLKRNAEGEGTAPLIVHRAHQRLPAWRLRIGSYPRPYRGGFPTGAAIVCCIGLSLLLLPVGNKPPDPSSPLAANAVAGVEAHNPLAEIVSAVAPAIMASADAATETRRPRRPAHRREKTAGTGSGSSLSPQAFDAMDKGSADPPARRLGRLPPSAAAMAGPAKERQAGTISSGAQGGKSAKGDRAGDGGSSGKEGPRSAPRTASREVDEVAMQRTVGRGSGNFANGRLAAAGNRADDGASRGPAEGHRRAERPASLPLVSALSPVQRDYVARYFQQLQASSMR